MPPPRTWRMGDFLGLAISGNNVDGRAPTPTAASLGLDSGFESFLGTRVDAGPRHGQGTIRFVGETAIGEGVWAGVELDKPLGKHDGAVFGVRYFDGRPRHGLMCNVEKLAPLVEVEQAQLASARARSGPPRAGRARSPFAPIPRGGRGWTMTAPPLCSGRRSSAASLPRGSGR